LSTPEELVARPPIGFVVEGTTEYNSYASLVCRCVSGGQTLYLPIANAKGNSRVIAELEELLEDLVATYHPMVVIVSLDERDPIREGVFASCAELRKSLQERCDVWLARESISGRFFPLPDQIFVVIQCPAFESWLLADLHGLASAIAVVHDIDTTLEWSDVDQEVRNPGEWLAPHVHPQVRLKPLGAAKIVRFLDPAIMELRSRSFRKFAKEVRAAYRTWASRCGIAP
jgi:hypothetical protein